MQTAEALPEIPVLEPITVRPLVKPTYTTTLACPFPAWFKANEAALRSWSTALGFKPEQLKGFASGQYFTKRSAECRKAMDEAVADILRDDPRWLNR